jgi:hypothetical protein
MKSLTELLSMMLRKKKPRTVYYFNVNKVLFDFPIILLQRVV